MAPSPQKEMSRRAPVYSAPTDDVYAATVKAVRSLPGWELLAAAPDDHAIRARARGRIFSPSMDHEFVLEGDGKTTRVRMTSRSTRTNTEQEDERGAAMFHAMLADHLAGRAPPQRDELRGRPGHP